MTEGAIMQTEIERIADQLKRAAEGEAWHGPSLQETLAEVMAEVAGGGLAGDQQDERGGVGTRAPRSTASTESSTMRSGA
jgi:hypothetical protein